jgi:hypothetical protein
MLDEEPGLLESIEVGVQWAMFADEGHLQAASFDVVLISERFEVRALDHEGTIRLVARKAAGGIQGMDDRDAKPASGRQYSPHLFDRGLHVVDILERHERDRQVGDLVAQWQASSIRLHRRDGRILRTGRGDQGPRIVAGHNPVAKGSEVARESPLPRADIQRQPPRRGQEFEKLVAVKAPETVVHRRARPSDPPVRLERPGRA